MTIKTATLVCLLCLLISCDDIPGDVHFGITHIIESLHLPKYSSVIIIPASNIEEIKSKLNFLHNVCNVPQSISLHFLTNIIIPEIIREEYSYTIISNSYYDYITRKLDIGYLYYSHNVIMAELSSSDIVADSDNIVRFTCIINGIENFCDYAGIFMRDILIRLNSAVQEVVVNYSNGGKRNCALILFNDGGVRNVLGVLPADCVILYGNDFSTKDLLHIQTNNNVNSQMSVASESLISKIKDALRLYHNVKINLLLRDIDGIVSVSVITARGEICN